MIDKKTLNQIDKKILSLKNKQVREIKLLEKTLNEIFNLLNLDRFREVEDFGAKKELVATICLRVLCVNENLACIDNQIKFKILSIIKDTLGSKYFRYWDIKEKDLKQNHLLISKLRGLEEKFKSNCEKFKSEKIINVESIVNFSNNFIAHIKQRQFSNYTVFVDSTLISPYKIKEVFSDTSFLLSDDYNEKIKQQQKLIKKISIYLVKLKQAKNSITDLLVIQPIKKVIEILQKDLPYEKQLRAAELIIEGLDRKYPLDILEEEFDIKLKIVNKGSGEANNVTVVINDPSKYIKLSNNEILIGDIKESIEILVKAQCHKVLDSENLPIDVSIKWNDFEGIDKEKKNTIVLQKQNSIINWKSVKNPYSTQFIDDKDFFIGREELIEELELNYESRNIESIIISGQKRVGKTSIAKLLVSLLNERENTLAIFVTTLEISKVSPKESIRELAETIILELADELPEELADSIEIPDFENSLSPLIRYLKNIYRKNKKQKIIIVIDEFDELPLELTVLPTSFRSTFLSNLRALIQTSHIGLVLVGGENMNYIKQHTQALNNVNNYYVDYFDKDNYWKDFVDLVVKPLRVLSIEYHNDAVNYLYQMTEGNPYYTKLICREVFNYVKGNRITYITKEIIEKITLNRLNLGINHVNHFWLDNIMEEVDERKIKIEKQRIKFLLAIAELYKRKEVFNTTNLEGIFNLKNEINIQKIFESFSSRNIFMQNKGRDSYRIKPKLFEYWLIEKGWKEISKHYLNEEALKIYQTKESQAFISDTELQEFLQEKSISTYKEGK